MGEINKNVNLIVVRRCSKRRWKGAIYMGYFFTYSW